MKAMVLEKTVDLNENKKPLTMKDVPDPKIGEGEILIKINACGVCHTEIDEIEGRVKAVLPVIPGHEAVGEVVGKSSEVDNFQIGDKVGVGWIFSSCGECNFCRRNLENLCPSFRATGRDADGGYAEYMKVNEHFAVKIPETFSDFQAAPLLCAGGVGYRSLKLTGISNGDNLGFIGFGASAHLVLQLAKYLYPETKLFVFARSEYQREFADKLGAHWSGDINDTPEDKCSAIIDTTPVYKTVMSGLKNLHPGGRFVINAISKEDTDKNVLKDIDYKEHLWMEKEVKSVANVTSDDIQNFLKIAEKANISPTVETYTLEKANEALVDIKNGSGTGAKVLTID